MTKPLSPEMAGSAAASIIPHATASASASSSTGLSSFPVKSHPTSANTSMTPNEVVRGLREVLGRVGSRAVVVCREEEARFAQETAIFNGAVKSPAFALVQPRSALDVSEIVKFCRIHQLDVSVKAGGTGVHGWSVMGHIVIDVSLLNDVQVCLPDSAPSLHETFQSLQIDDPPRSPTATSSKRSLDNTTHFDDSQGPGKRRGELWVGGAARVTSPESGSGSSGSRSGSGSGSGSGSASNSGGSNNSADPTRTSSGSNGTPNSSLHGSASGSGSSKIDNAIVDGNGHGNGNGNAPPPPPSLELTGISRNRTTYINPSPTASSVFPFVTNRYGSSLSMDSAFSHAQTSLSLNTNPDPPAYTVVTFGAGVDSKQLDSATAASPYGAFHVPTSAFPVGAGQFLLGGFGFLGRKHGLAMDNLVEAEVVLADGRIVWVGEGGKHGGEWRDDEDPDEVWAKAYYVPSVFAGNFIYVFDRATTPSLLRHVRDVIKGAPRSLYANIIMTAGPPGAPAIVVIQLCFSGKREEGETYVQAISSWEGGRCLFQDFSERTFERQQLAVEEILKGGRTRKWYIKSDMLKSLSDEVIEESCARFHTVPDGCTWIYEFTGGGAQSDVSDSCFPPSHRQGQFTVAALHQWSHFESPAEDKRCIVTAESWINEVIHPNSPGGPLPCFLQASTPPDVRGVYASNFPRLQRLKKKMDPVNFFKYSLWPPQTSPYEDGDAFDGRALVKGDSENGDADSP